MEESFRYICIYVTKYGDHKYLSITDKSSSVVTNKYFKYNLKNANTYNSINSVFKRLNILLKKEKELSNRLDKLLIMRIMIDDNAIKYIHDSKISYCELLNLEKLNLI